MNNKKIILIILICLLIVSGVVSGILYFNSIDIDKNNDGIPDDSGLTINKDGTVVNNDGYIIYNPNYERKEYKVIAEQNLNSINDVTEEFIEEYLKILVMELHGKTYEKFTKEEISRFISVLMLTNDDPKSSRIKSVVKKYFDIDNFVLPIGIYNSNKVDEFIVAKYGDIYYSTLLARGTDCPCNMFQTLERNNKEFIATYLYGMFDYEETPTMSNSLGVTKVYMKYDNKMLHVKKIIYTPNE